MDWIDSFIIEIEKQNVNGMIEVLQQQATNHANTPKQSIKERAIKEIKKMHKENQYLIGMKLANSKNIIGEELGVILIAQEYLINQVEVEAKLYEIADSPNWEVREWAASACSIILANYFNKFYPTLTKWTKDTSPNIRRAVVVAVKYVSKIENEEMAKLLLDLIEPLLLDSDTYVKKNLGAFAIGDGLLKYHPEEVLRRLPIWLNDKNENLRWNIAMIFSSARGCEFIEGYIYVINQLLEDERTTVKKAIKSTLNVFKKRKPNIYSKGKIF